jgi:hypothetical protein
MSNVVSPHTYEDRDSGSFSQLRKMQGTEKMLSLDLQNLHDTMSHKAEWVNIQRIIRQSINYLMNIAISQQNQISSLTDSQETMTNFV